MALVGGRITSPVAIFCKSTWKGSISASTTTEQQNGLPVLTGFDIGLEEISTRNQKRCAITLGGCIGNAWANYHLIE
jgi:hypothetical protein